MLLLGTVPSNAPVEGRNRELEQRFCLLMVEVFLLIAVRMEEAVGKGVGASKQAWTLEAASGLVASSLASQSVAVAPTLWQIMFTNVP